MAWGYDRNPSWNRYVRVADRRKMAARLAGEARAKGVRLLGRVERQQSVDGVGEQHGRRA